MNIGDRVLLDGKITGTIRYIRNGMYGVHRHDTGTTRYYDAYRLTRIEDEPTPEERLRIGDAVRHKPSGAVGRLVAVGHKKALFKADDGDADGHPIIQADEFDAFERLSGGGLIDQAAAVQIGGGGHERLIADEANHPIHGVFGEADQPTADEDEPPITAARGARTARLCVMCGAPMDGRRADAKTCSAACRKRLHRRKDDLEERYHAARGN